MVVDGGEFFDVADAGPIAVVGRAGGGVAWLSPSEGIAVIGVGHLEKYYARLWRGFVGRPTSPQSSTRIPDRAAAAAGDHRARRPSADHRVLFDVVDAVMVAVPTESHHAIPLPLPRGGTPCSSRSRSHGRSREPMR